MTVRTRIRTSRIKLLCRELPLKNTQVRHRYTRSDAALTYKPTLLLLYSKLRRSLYMTFTALVLFSDLGVAAILLLRHVCGVYKLTT